MKVYHFSNCSTCKQAIKFLKEERIDFELISIVDSPPSKTELRQMLDIVRARGGDLRNLFNTSGLVYRELKISDRMKNGLSDDEAIDLLSKNGKLIKRPFVLTKGWGAVGFKVDEWRTHL